MTSSKLLLSAAFAAAVLSNTAKAHIGYGGRDFGTLSIGSLPTLITGQAVSSSFGWADATDADYGDSHRGRFYRFKLTSTATVTITAQRVDLPVAVSGAGTQTGAQGLFLPAFSLYQGLGHLTPYQGSHDGAALSIASRPLGTEGSTLALADWSIGNDPTYNTAGVPSSGVLYPADLRAFTYVGHAADGTSANYGSALGIAGDGLADGQVSATFVNLVPGDYSIWLAGASYNAQFVETATYGAAANAFPTYGASLSVQAVPEPALAGAALAALALATALRRQRGNSKSE